MILTVVGKPNLGIGQPAGIPKQRIIATYDPRTETTVIDTDVDVVTLGIAANILQRCFNDYLGTLDPHLAKQIHDTIIKVVNDNEKHSGKDSEPVCNRRCREADGSNGQNDAAR